MRRTQHKEDGPAVQGTLVLTGKGFGFVDPEEGPSILIPFDHLGRALSGDLVRAEIFPDSAPDKPAGRVTEIVARGGDSIVGRLQVQGSSIRLHPQANRSARPLTIPVDEWKRFSDTPARDGDVVEVAFLDWPDETSAPIGRPVSIIAHRSDDDLELKLIARSRDIPLSFPEAVENAAARLSFPTGRALTKRRLDLRDLTCFTIDPATAKDFDDAVSIEQLDNGLFLLGVHIADVSHFVPPDSPLDREAWSRGTSVYLVDTVLPMLPESLSNGLCSLVPDQDRLAVSVLASVDSTGEVHDVQIEPSVIRSRRRLTYQEAGKIIEGADDALARPVQLLHLLSQVLHLRREAEGSVDLDLTRPQIRTDDDGVPVSVRPAQRRAANRMIEECMLLANRLVAEELESNEKLDAIYRVHAAPRESDLQNLVRTLNELGVPYRPDGAPGADDYRRILSFIQNFEFRDLVEMLALKSLQKAVYSVENGGHFGLAMRAYTHFTSPIRRYPDLVVHRLIKARRRGRAGGRNPTQAWLLETCTQANQRERLATEAEREYSRLKALEFLSERVGREYGGVVSGVASIGIFVEIERYLIEGLVHISKLGPDRFSFDRASYRLVGAKSGVEYHLGDEVRVRVERVDTRARTADFALVRSPKEP